MIVLRYLYVLALVVWLGGMLALGGVAAPSVFAVLQGHGATAGPELAGAVIADMFRTFYRITYGCGGTMLVALAGMRVLGPKPVQFNARVAIVGSMLGAALASGFLVSGGPAREQQPARPSAATAAPRLLGLGTERVRNLSVVLLLIDVVGGLSLLYWEARE